MFQIFVSIEVLNKGIYSGLLKYKSSSLLCFNCAYIYVFLFKQLFYNTIYGGKQKYAILLNNNFVSSTIWVVFVLAAW